MIQSEKKEIVLNAEKIQYALRQSGRARRMRLTVHAGGDFVVTVPSWLQRGSCDIEKFLQAKATWIVGAIKRFRTIPKPTIPKASRRDYLTHKEAARQLVHARLAYFNQFYGFQYGRVSVKNQKSCWGSCSKRGNLNFNYRIVMLRPELADYIIVHELCHLGELNHSRQFWNLVVKTVPSYKILRKELRLV